MKNIQQRIAENTFNEEHVTVVTENTFNEELTTEDNREHFQ